MAQPQKLGSEKFAALHTAFVREGAFIYVPRGVEIPTPILVTHAAAGAAAAVFPHTLVVLEENAKATVVDYFVSADNAPHFACGANDLYAVTAHTLPTLPPKAGHGGRGPSTSTPPSFAATREFSRSMSTSVATRPGMSRSRSFRRRRVRRDARAHRG
jgi:hypothetical protein